MGHSQPPLRRLALELGRGGWGSGGWLQLSGLLSRPQSCPCARAPAAWPGTVPGPPGPRGSRAPAAVGWASSAACGPTTPQGPADTGAPTCLQPTRNAASATCELAQVRWVVSAQPDCPSLASVPHPTPGPSISSGTSPQARGTLWGSLPEPDPWCSPSLAHSVPGGWSRWSPWSWCDRSCGGGRSLRSRSCSSPPPKNGGAPCVGERHHARLCNPAPCGTAVVTALLPLLPAKLSPPPPLISPPTSLCNVDGGQAATSSASEGNQAPQGQMVVGPGLWARTPSGQG